MEQSDPPSAVPSRDSTPNPAANPRFSSQNVTAEDVLKEQTVGLVQLSDFRKRRAQAFTGAERESSATPGGSGASTPAPGEPTPPAGKKKRKTAVAKGKLSFGFDDEDGADDSSTSAGSAARPRIPKANTAEVEGSEPEPSDGGGARRRLAPNAKHGFVPKAMTKTQLLREAQTRAQLAAEYQMTQRLVKETDVIQPFVFFDGTNIPGGRCRVKKSDQIWLFLDKARKVGAELGVGGDKGRREWARISVDDLMLVKGDLIIPHHYEFYYFIVNKSVGFNGRLFNFSDQPTAATPKSLDDDESVPANYNPLSKAGEKKQRSVNQTPDAELEGYNEDPSLTKVVDRRWYERNKHIYPMTTWEEFDATKDYSTNIRKDALGNAFFFS